MSINEKKPQASPEPISPVITSGSGAPSDAPLKVGDIYVDTAGGKVYCAVAVSASTDFKILN